MRNWHFNAKLEILAETEDEACQVIRDFFKTFGSIEDEIAPDGLVTGAADLTPGLFSTGEEGQ